jgi:hypothetical protein
MLFTFSESLLPIISASRNFLVISGKECPKILKLAIIASKEKAKDF